MKGVTSFEPAGSGFLETFGRAPVGFHLGHGVAPSAPFRGSLLIHVAQAVTQVTLLLLLGIASIAPADHPAFAGTAQFTLIFQRKEIDWRIQDLFGLTIITICRPSMRGNCSTVISLARSSSTRLSIAVPSS
jgi:hypothetical protein